MIPHSIRLRHPWDEVAPSTPDRKAFRRRFNRPTGLDPWETVSLEVDRVLYCGEVALNGTALGELQTSELFAADVTGLLQESNLLTIEVDPKTAADKLPSSASIYIVDAEEPPGSPIGDVRLVIRAHSAPGGD